MPVPERERETRAVHHHFLVVAVDNRPDRHVVCRLDRALTRVR